MKTHSMPPYCPVKSSSVLSLITLFVSLPLFLFSQCGSAASAGSSAFGLDSRPRAQAYLRMPQTADGNIPRRLSETGAFIDTKNLTPSDSLIPYDLNIAFWSDGASKSRWISVPHQDASHAPSIDFAPVGEWKFPKGTVFVKHFELPIDETRPDLKRRLETRLLVCDATGAVYGVTYKWRADNTDADLLADSLVEPIAIKTATGTRTQEWFYPARADCRTCHTDNAGGVLGVKTRQLNFDMTYPQTGRRDNQLRVWNHLGLFTRTLDDNEIARCRKLAHPDDPAASLEDRARSYLDANCSQCHRPGGTILTFDLRYDTPLTDQRLIDEPVLIDEGVDRARLVAPHDTWRSILYRRVNTLEAFKMPPLARGVIDERGVALLRDWIKSLPGPDVLDPPVIDPRGGEFAKPIDVTLKAADPGAVIRYTLDGEVPGKDSPMYTKPIHIDSPVTLRTRAFKPGFTRSITVQETFIVVSSP
jgi:uncharacterized repeat protein (TIGR03806 family)